MEGWEKLIDAATQTTLVARVGAGRARNMNTEQSLILAVQEFRKHLSGGCNRCFQGIYCPDKYRLQVEVVRLEKQLKAGEDVKGGG